MLDNVDQVEEDRSRYLYTLFSIHPLPRNQLLAHTPPTQSDDFCFSFLFLPLFKPFPSCRQDPGPAPGDCRLRVRTLQPWSLGC